MLDCLVRWQEHKGVNSRSRWIFEYSTMVKSLVHASFRDQKNKCYHAKKQDEPQAIEMCVRLEHGRKR